MPLRGNPVRLGANVSPPAPNSAQPRLLRHPKVYKRKKAPRNHFLGALLNLLRFFQLVLVLATLIRFYCTFLEILEVLRLHLIDLQFFLRILPS